MFSYFLLLFNIHFIVKTNYVNGNVFRTGQKESTSFSINFSLLSCHSKCVLSEMNEEWNEWEEWMNKMSACLKDECFFSSIFWRVWFDKRIGDSHWNLVFFLFLFFFSFRNCPLYTMILGRNNYKKKQTLNDYNTERFFFHSLVGW